MVVNICGQRMEGKVDHHGLSFEDRVKMHEIEKRFDLSLVAEDDYFRLAAVMPEFMIPRFLNAYSDGGWATYAERVYQNTVHFEFFRRFSPIE